MATHQLPILWGSVEPDTSGNCYPVSYATPATNDVWQAIVFVFKDTSTRIGLHGRFTVPQNYVGTPVFVVVWSTTATSGNVVWDLDYRTVGGDDTTSFDQNTVEQALTVTDAAPGAAHRRLTPSLSATAANFAAGETVEFIVFRDGADAADTMAADALLFEVQFQYADV